MTGHLERLREAELESVRRFISPGMRILELGGGNGVQAARLTAWGADVASIDVPGRRRPAVQHFPVADYDGEHIPFADATFDLVFSSNVLEHLVALPQILRESVRVLKPGGRAIHIVPSVAWRWWTSLAHYPYLVKYLATREMPMPDGQKAPDAAMVARRKGVGHVIRRALTAGPHGEFTSAAAELYHFRVRQWRRILAANGFDVEDVFSAGVFHTGYAIAPWLSIAARSRLARLLGPACKVYVAVARKVM